MIVESAPVRVARLSFTADQFERMGTMGFFAEKDRLELINGDIVQMSPIGSLHAAGVNRIVDLFRKVDNTFISVQNPIRLDDATEPQPDVTLLRRRGDFYASAHPRPADVLLLVEVADTSLDYDREIKIPLYAAAGIPEVWLLNLNGPELVVYRSLVSGKYTEVRYPQPGDTITPAQLPGATFPVDRIMGGAEGNAKF
jgi:Uma2 family endonuclease